LIDKDLFGNVSTHRIDPFDQDENSQDSCDGFSTPPPVPHTVKERTGAHPATHVDVETSYLPVNAWEDVPARVFSWKANQLRKASERAKSFARSNRRAIYALEVTDGRKTMNYVVGNWQTAVDMVLHGRLCDRNGPTRLMQQNPAALTAVYECMFEDQQILPYFDLEFYADQEHGNAHRTSIYSMDAMTAIIARLASQLMAQLFPDQVQVASSKSQPRDKNAQDPAEAVAAQFYRPPQGLCAPPVQIDPERHWHALDASRGSKRSQHLILDASAGLCWDTQIDQAIFVGLLVRHIYAAAFRPAKQNVPDAARDDAQRLFVLDQCGVTGTTIGPKASQEGFGWTLVLDPVVYKSFQLFRTAYSSKRTENRPLLYRREVFDADNAKSSRSSNAMATTMRPKEKETRTNVLLQTLLGRVPRHNRTQRLSFARCYPGLFSTGATITTTATSDTTTSSLPLDRWHWVPNYLGRGPMAPPTLVHSRKEPTSRGPWRFARHRKAVQAWLRSTDPTRRSPTLMQTSANGGGTYTPGQWVREPGPSPSVVPFVPQDPINFADNRQPRTDRECIAMFIARATMLQPWLRAAKSLETLVQNIRVDAGSYVNKKTGKRRLTALASPNLHWCPISKRNHEGSGAFLLIDGIRGTVSVKCLADKCKGRRIYVGVAMLPEQLDLIFEERRVTKKRARALIAGNARKPKTPARKKAKKQ
jgi:hypothetical protein